MSHQPRNSRLGEWNEESDDVEEEIVTGSVVEFAFGEGEKSYFATSYPHRAEFSRRKDIRLMEQLNMPDYVLETIRKVQPKYIMNLAIRGPDLWFLYYYSSSSRYGHDTKWFPKKPTGTDEYIGVQLEKLREDARDQISFCGFGPSPDVFYLRSTDNKKGWHPRLSRYVCDDLWNDFLDVSRLDQGCPRAVTFGKNNTWIVYGVHSLKWSKHGLPKSLVAALKLGEDQDWVINKVVLNRSNHREYVLVYDSGPVYYSFHPDFEAQFNKVIEQWSVEKRKCRRSTGHEPSYPAGNQYDNPDDSGSEVGDDEVEWRMPEPRKGNKTHHHRHDTAVSQLSQASPNNSRISGLSTEHQPDNGRRLRADSEEYERITNPPQGIPPDVSASASGRVTRHSSKMPVRTPLPDQNYESTEQKELDQQKRAPKRQPFTAALGGFKGFFFGEKEKGTKKNT